MQFVQIFGAVITHVGVDVFLAACPLDIDVDAAVLNTDLRRSWLLPLLQRHVLRAPLAYYAQHLLPLTLRLGARIKAAQSMSSTAVRVYSALHDQLWQLLVSFCRQPSDLDTQFK